MKPRVVILGEDADGFSIGAADEIEIHPGLRAVHRLDSRPAAGGNPVDSRNILVR